MKLSGIALGVVAIVGCSPSRPSASGTPSPSAAARPCADILAAYRADSGSYVDLKQAGKDFQAGGAAGFVKDEWKEGVAAGCPVNDWLPTPYGTYMTARYGPNSDAWPSDSAPGDWCDDFPGSKFC